MAIDLMVMPLCRYVSGDFVTPMMRLSWDQGASYAIFRPDGSMDEFPQNTPYGGSQAPDLCKQIKPLFVQVAADLASSFGQPPWDEEADTEPLFFRPEKISYRALQGEAANQRNACVHFLNAPIFVNLDMAQPIKIRLGECTWVLGSMPALKQELLRGNWSLDAQSAKVTVLNAILEAERIRFPLIIDQ